MKITEDIARAQIWDGNSFIDDKDLGDNERVYVEGVRRNLAELAKVHKKHAKANAVKRRYYEGHIPLSEVNLGLALPNTLQGLEIDCAWGTKAVDVLAARSMFDGFVGEDGDAPELIAQLTRDNNLIYNYSKAVKDELKYGSTFSTLSRDVEIGCRIRFHSPESAAALWSGEKERIACGIAVIETEEQHDANGIEIYMPTHINYYDDLEVWELIRINGGKWSATRHRQAMGRPLMEPLVWMATSAKPFGRSRLKKPIRSMIQSYVRTLANASIGLEFATSPQKYILGVTDEQFDKITGEKFKQYVGAIMTATTNPETQEKPTFGQLAQGNIEPHVQMLRMLATQFCAASSLSSVDVGVVNDANPSSADAILAQERTLVGMAEELNEGNGGALGRIAMMAQAIARNVTPDELTEEELAAIPHFRNPAMPSVSVTADAAVKIGGARPSFAQTDTFLEMIGFSPADIRRIRAQEAKNRGLTVLTEEFRDDDLDN